MIVFDANGGTVIKVLYVRRTTVDVIVSDGVLDVTVNSRQVAFLGKSSAREGCSCDSRSKNCLFHVASSYLC